MSIAVVTLGAEGTALVGGLERLHGPVTVVRRCAELAELIAACQGGLASVAVVVGSTDSLTATFVDRLAEVGVAIVGLADDDGERLRLAGLGVRSAPQAVEPRELARLIAEAADDLSNALSDAVDDAQREGPRGGGAPSSSFSLAGARPVPQPVPKPAAKPGSRRHSRATDGAPGYSTGDDLGAENAAAPGASETGAPPAEPARAEAARQQGSLIAVWGPIGSPGRTTIAVNLAGELAAEGQRVVLVDADTFGPSIAAHLGLLDESAGIAQACRLADQGTLDRETLGRIASTVVTSEGTLLALTGLTRADRWPELRAASFAAVLERCREIADTVVVDAGFSLEADEELSFDTMAPRRNAATLRALENADRVLAVGAADAVGMPRLVRGLSELERAVPHAAPDVVFNKIRRGALGRFPERALREAWERFGPDRSIAAFVPYDADAADAALLGGHLLLESAPHSALRRAIAGIACTAVQQNRKSAVSSARALAKRSR